MNNLFNRISDYVATRMPIRRVRKILIIGVIGITAGYLSLQFWFDSDPRKSQLLEFVRTNSDVQDAVGAIQDVYIIRKLYAAPSENQAGYREYTFHVKGVKTTLSVLVRVDAVGEDGNEAAFRLISIK